MLMTVDIQTNMTRIGGGDIRMRDDRVKSSWTEQIRPFLASRFPVTQKLYEEVTGDAPSAYPGDDCPVERVSWLDAVRFCNQLSVMSGLAQAYSISPGDDFAAWDTQCTGYRLLTDEEWQFACQAGRPDPVYGPLSEIAWYKENSGGHTHPVGQKRPNAWGLHDMLGNVWEWCWNQYDPNVYGPYRIFRGGGWADEPRGCLATNRRRSHPTFKIDDLGFRIARSIME